MRFEIRVPPALARFIAPKGSVTVDGISLTVNEVDGTRFGVNVIPRTQAETTLGRLGRRRASTWRSTCSRVTLRAMDRTPA